MEAAPLAATLGLDSREGQKRGSARRPLHGEPRVGTQQGETQGWEEARGQGDTQGSGMKLCQGGAGRAAVV